MRPCSTRNRLSRRSSQASHAAARAGVVVAGKLSPQRVQQRGVRSWTRASTCSLSVSSTVSARHISSRREPSLKRFIWLDIPVIVGGVCTDTAALPHAHRRSGHSCGIWRERPTRRQSPGVRADSDTIADVAAAAPWTSPAAVTYVIADGVARSDLARYRGADARGCWAALAPRKLQARRRWGFSRPTLTCRGQRRST